MNITLSIDERLIQRAREKLRAAGRTVNQEIREHLERIVGDDDIERDIKFLEETAGRGNSSGWKYSREDAYENRQFDSVNIVNPFL